MIPLERLLADRLRAVVAAIAAVTVLSGAGQLLLPGTVLDLLGAESTATTRQLFAIVGMFMAVVGAVTLQALLSEPTPTYVVLWCAVQKLGAFVAVTVGVLRDLFSWVAVAVALFDLLTAVLAALLWQRLRLPAGRHQRARVPA
jgi:O-antigen/teichoic acid export membrane protein